jgi:carbohydrate-selective porin OprB
MPYLVATRAVRDWVNGNGLLVGPGRPLALGAFLEPPRSPGSGGYALLSRVGRAGDLVAEETIDSPRISATILAGTYEAAETAATAYANAVDGLRGVRAAMGDATCLVADNIAGPLYVDLRRSTQEQYQFLVDADFYLI